MRHGGPSEATSDCRRCRFGHTVGRLRMARSRLSSRPACVLVHARSVQRGTRIGYLALYARAPGSPTAHHQHLIQQMTHLAAVAIEQARAAEKLRQDERELRQLIDFVPQSMFAALDPNGSFLYANQVVLE